MTFPGQGSLHRAPFKTGALRARMREVVREIGAADYVTGALCDGLLPTPERLSLFVFAASVAHYRVLQSLGVRPGALMGHGFGEIVALVCGGGFSAAQGAAIVLHRAAALERCCDQAGRMVVARTTRATAGRLVDSVGRDRVAVAAENSRTEIVLSGTRSGLDALLALARKEAIAWRDLSAPWPLHCHRAMRHPAADLVGRLRHLATGRLHTPVFSPILARYYRDSDNLVECLSLHLTAPVRFADAFDKLWSEGFRTFLTCGPLRGLDRSIADLIRGGSAAAAVPAETSTDGLLERPVECQALAS